MLGGCIQNMLWQLYITHGICIVSLVQVASWRRHRKCTTVTHGLASCTLQLFGMYRCFKCTGLKVCMGNLTLLLFRIQIQKQIYQLKTSYKAITFRTFHMMIVSQIIVINDLCFCPWQLHFHLAHRHLSDTWQIWHITNMQWNYDIITSLYFKMYTDRGNSQSTSSRHIVSLWIANSTLYDFHNYDKIIVIMSNNCD